MKKRKKSNYRLAKAKAWKAFSRHVRLSAADRFGYVTCVTCRGEYHWKDMQAGHFVDGRNNTVLFDERLVHPQCYYCNCQLKGNKIQYTLFMKKKFGYTDEQIEEFDSLKYKEKKYTIPELEEIAQKYYVEITDGEYTK